MAEIRSIHPNMNVAEALRKLADDIGEIEGACLTIITDDGDIIRLGEINDVSSANRAIIALNLALHKQMARALQEMTDG